jgi:hypothetical protein
MHSTMLTRPVLGVSLACSAELVIVELLPLRLNYCVLLFAAKRPKSSQAAFPRVEGFCRETEVVHETVSFDLLRIPA